jgi:hypothetical protein
LNETIENFLLEKRGKKNFLSQKGTKELSEFCQIIGEMGSH